MNTALARVDDAVRTLLSIHDSRAGRPMTRNQAADAEQARRALNEALADGGIGLGDYVRGLAERAASTEDPDAQERYTRELGRVVERSRAWGASPEAGYQTMRVEAPSGRADGDSIADLIRNFRSHGYAAIEFEPSEKYTTRALQSAGGSAVPTTFADRVAMYQRYASPMLDGSIVSVETRTSGNPLVFPRLTADPATGGTVTAEGGAIAELDATISSITITPAGYKTIQNWSRELDTDEVIGLEDLLARSVARALAIDSGAHLTTGSGTGAYGIVTRSTNGGTAQGTATGTSADVFWSPSDLLTLKYAQSPIYRARGAFMVSTPALAKMRKFKDANGQFMLNPATGPGGVPTFDGSPVYENPAINGGSAVGSATKSVLFGDMSAYQTVRVATRIELSYDAKWGTDQVSLRVVDRVSGDLPDTAAVLHQVAADT